jgi:hypothetical protein
MVAGPVPETAKLDVPDVPTGEPVAVTITAEA